MHQQKSLSEHSEAARLLVEFTDKLDLLKTFGNQPRAVLRYGLDGVRAIRDSKERVRRRGEIRRLEKRRLIKIRKTAETYRIALTGEGALQVFRLKVLQSDFLPNDRVCMVVFDIPETERGLRASMRRFLSKAGFIPIQRSVWISPFDAVRPLTLLFHSTSVDKWVRIYLAFEVDVTKKADM